MKKLFPNGSLHSLKLQLEKGKTFSSDFLFFQGRFHLLLNNKLICYESNPLPITISFIVKDCKFQMFSVSLKEIREQDIHTPKEAHFLDNLEQFLSTIGNLEMFKSIKEEIFDLIIDEIDKEPDLHNMRFFFLPI